MYSRANMTSPMTILRYIRYIDSKSRVELSWGALGVSRAQNKDKVRRQDKLSSLLFGGIWPPTASFTVRLFMYSRRVDTGGLGLYYIYCIYLCISVYTPAGPAPLCTQYYPCIQAILSPKMQRRYFALASVCSVCILILWSKESLWRSGCGELVRNFSRSFKSTRSQLFIKVWGGGGLGVRIRPPLN